VACRPSAHRVRRLGLTALVAVATALAAYSCSAFAPVIKVRSLSHVWWASEGMRVGSAVGSELTRVVPKDLWDMQDWARTSGLSRSGFPAAFAIIFVSEIGDKTFFIAALLAMKVRCCRPPTLAPG